jgi:hypothetical protein
MAFIPMKCCGNSFQHSESQMKMDRWPSFSSPTQKFSSFYHNLMQQFNDVAILWNCDMRLIRHWERLFRPMKQNYKADVPLWKREVKPSIETGLLCSWSTFFKFGLVVTLHSGWNTVHLQQQLACEASRKDTEFRAWTCSRIKRGATRGFPQIHHGSIKYVSECNAVLDEISQAPTVNIITLLKATT